MVLLLAATAAAIVPAQRATRVDPVQAIRTEYVSLRGAR